MPTVTNNIIVSSVGASVLNTTDPSSVSWIRVNADNTITYRSAAQTLSDLGAQAAGTYLVPADIGVTVQGYNANTTILGNSTTGSGSIVLATSPTIATSLILDYGTASTVVYLNASKQLISLANGTGVLTNNGSGTLTWAAASSGITVGTTTITSGTSLRIPYNLAGVYQEQANFTIGSVATGVLDVPVGYAIGGINFAKIYAYGGPAFSLTIGNNTSTNSHQVIIDPYGGISSAANFITVVGARNGTPTYGSISLGGYAGQGTTMGLHANALGFYTSATFGSSIALGSLAATTKANQLVIGGDASSYSSGSTVGISEVVIGNGVTNTSATSVVIQPTGGSGTNKAGANITIAGGKSTGTAAGGYVKTTTSVKRASGTTQQSDTDRNVIVGKYVDITESAATTYGTLALTTSGTIAGGTIIYTIEANDGTDYQSLTGNAVYSVVNKAGTLTVTFTDLTQALAESAGGSTLTSTMTATVSGTSVLFQANAVSSLVQTTLRISFQVLNNFGPAIVTPA